jgi:hypothetical protein
MARFRFLDTSVRLICRIPNAAKDVFAVAAVIDQFLVTAIPGKFPKLGAAHPQLGATISLVIPCIFFLLLLLSYGVRPLLTYLLRRSIIKHFDQAYPGRLEDYARKPLDEASALFERDPIILTLNARSHISAQIVRKVARRSKLIGG